MKTNKDFQTKSKTLGAEDLLRKAAKLDPIKKSGKDRHRVFASNDDDDDIIIPRHKESVLDYFDDVPEKPENDDQEEFDDDYDQDDDDADYDDEDEDEEEDISDDK